MRYLGLFALVTVVWLLVAMAGAARQALQAAHKGTTSGGTSILGGLFVGWALFALATGIDLFPGSRQSDWSVGFWAILVLHALLGTAALAYWLYAAVALRRKDREEHP